MAEPKEIEGNWIVGWRDRRRAQPLPGKEEQSRVADERDPRVDETPSAQH